MPVMDSNEMNTDSYEILEGSSNENRYQSETGSSRDDNYGRSFCLNIGNKLIRIDHECFECVQDLQSISTDTNKRAQEFNKLIENLKAEATKALRRIKHTKATNAFSKCEKLIK